MPSFALELNHLSKTYPNGVVALNPINLTVKPGDFFALLGANGAGKSTTIGLIASLIQPTSGTIRIQDHDIKKKPGLAKSALGLVPQEVNLNIFETPKHILANQAGYYGISRREALPRAEYLLEALGLIGKQNTIVRHLSGGMKRRLMIARALIHQPRLLILDEPTAGVDVEIRHAMWEFLKKTNAEGTTIILTTHYLEEAEQLCKTIAILHQGKLLKHESTQTLMSNLHHQTFILTTRNPLYEKPNLPFSTTLIDNTTFEVRIAERVPLNDLFSLLSKEKIEISSLRNKTNRLEELFMDVIKS